MIYRGLRKNICINSRNLIFISILLCLLVAGVQTQETVPSLPFRWQVGEKLIYAVKWSFIKLGELKLQILEKRMINNRPAYYCRINIDSSPGLPFITIHDEFESYVDSARFYSHLFQSFEKKGSGIVYTQYRYNPHTKNVAMRVEKREEDNIEIVLDSTTMAASDMYESLSMLFYARGMVKLKKNVEVNLIMNTEFVKTDINFTAQRHDVDFEDKEVNCFYVDGRLKFIGIAGVKDYFEGWFSPDPQSVPLKAKMKAFIGSVSIELIEWSKWEKQKK